MLLLQVESGEVPVLNQAQIEEQKAICSLLFFSTANCHTIVHTSCVTSLCYHYHHTIRDYYHFAASIHGFDKLVRLALR